jgi:hypothetical protein
MIGFADTDWPWPEQSCHVLIKPLTRGVNKIVVQSLLFTYCRSFLNYPVINKKIEGVVIFKMQKERKKGKQIEKKVQQKGIRSL